MKSRQTDRIINMKLALNQERAMHISFDSSLLLAENVGDHGLNQETLNSSECNATFTKISSQFQQDFYPFITMLAEESIISECRRVFSSISWAKQLVVLGIGGSDLGGRMLQQALQTHNPPMAVLFAGDTTDPEEYHQLLKQINFKECVVNVISKSGSTTETAVGYLYLKELFKKELGDKWTKHFIFTTDTKEGILRLEADSHHITTLPVPEGVGGRYSVFSAVGLFPALAMGIDIEKLSKGAREFSQKLNNMPVEENMAWQLALSQYLFQTQKGVNTVVLMPYIWRMELFAVWFRQLWAESLGKNGKGILPIKAMGPTDQHSQVQFYNEGMWLSTFILYHRQKLPARHHFKKH